MHKHQSTKQGFTLLEILLVVAAIGILAGIVIIAINPGRQLAATRNAQRKIDVNTILNAVYQYSLDHNGQFPSEINTNSLITCNQTADSLSYSICKTSTGCSGVNMVNELTGNGTYLTAIPSDPSGYVNPISEENTHTGYFILKQDNGRISVCAPLSENGEEIIVTR